MTESKGMFKKLCLLYQRGHSLDTERENLAPKVRFITYWVHDGNSRFIKRGKKLSKHIYCHHFYKQAIHFDYFEKASLNLSQLPSGSYTLLAVGVSDNEISKKTVPYRSFIPETKTVCFPLETLPKSRTEKLLFIINENFNQFSIFPFHFFYAYK